MTTVLPDALSARQEREENRRLRRDKSMTAREAVERFVHDGDVIAVGGTNHARTPMALLVEVLRQGRRELSLARPLSCFESELFIAAGAATRVITSWVGIGHRWGLARVLREYVESGRIDYEEWSHLGLGLRYKAGAMGVPFLPSYTMLGSDLGKNLQLAKVDCPYTGQSLNAVPSLNPDVALLHVQRADVFGNAQIDGYELMDVDVSQAARRVIVSAEEIVTTEELQRDPARTIIPGFAVDAVVHQPYGAYPHECYGRYLSDDDAFRSYVDHVRTAGAEGARRWVGEMLAHPDHDAYLAQLPEGRLERLSAEAEEMMPR